MRTTVRSPLSARAQVGKEQEKVMREMLEEGVLTRIMPLLPEVLKEAVEMGLVDSREKDTLIALEESSGWAHLYLCQKEDGSWIIIS